MEELIEQMRERFDGFLNSTIGELKEQLRVAQRPSDEFTGSRPDVDGVEFELAWPVTVDALAVVGNGQFMLATRCHPDRVDRDKDLVLHGEPLLLLHCDSKERRDSIKTGLIAELNRNRSLKHLQKSPVGWLLSPTDDEGGGNTRVPPVIAATTVASALNTVVEPALRNEGPQAVRLLYKHWGRKDAVMDELTILFKYGPFIKEGTVVTIDIGSQVGVPEELVRNSAASLRRYVPRSGRGAPEHAATGAAHEVPAATSERPDSSDEDVEEEDNNESSFPSPSPSSPPSPTGTSSPPPPPPTPPPAAESFIPSSSSPPPPPPPPPPPAPRPPAPPQQQQQQPQTGMRAWCKWA
jgi:hypothetical protein